MSGPPVAVPVAQPVAYAQPQVAMQPGVVQQPYVVSNLPPAYGTAAPDDATKAQLGWVMFGLAWLSAMCTCLGLPVCCCCCLWPVFPCIYYCVLDRRQYPQSQTPALANAGSCACCLCFYIVACMAFAASPEMQKEFCMKVPAAQRELYESTCAKYWNGRYGKETTTLKSDETLSVTAPLVTGSAEQQDDSLGEKRISATSAGADDDNILV
eukprot:TRINITY_DN19286_c0_g1_i1.p1 TRINITY_DN19286_c0_g1~~TRINITY_DN19286_c0_g1_i1.p1  ORF type:complete len:211 (-),score=33.79 TRINITY_DN19286_c0_g1_i1:197-829(-)